MLMMLTDATMLQVDDAALAADVMRFDGANQRELWLGRTAVTKFVRAAEFQAFAQDTSVSRKHGKHGKH